MIKNADKLKERIKDKLDTKVDEFVNNLDLKSDTDEFTIDTIEDIMTRFNAEEKTIMIEAINEALASFDEKEIIAKKNER